MALEMLILSSLASYGVYRKAKDLFKKYEGYCINHYSPSDSQSDLDSIFNTIKHAGIGIASVFLYSSSFSLLYSGLWFYFSNK